MTPSAAAVATAASTALPPERRTAIPAALASASTLATAPPYPTATGTFAGVPAAACDGGAAAPVETSAPASARSAN